MKRSQHIRLVLVGGLSSAALTTGDSFAQVAGYTLRGNAFTNDHYLPNAGYYHAPYRAWFPHRYNHFDPQRKQYFHGGQWSDQSHQSFTNISTPLPESIAAVLAAQPRPPVHNSSSTSRSGFGSTSRSSFSGGSS